MEKKNSAMDKVEKIVKNDSNDQPTKAEMLKEEIKGQSKTAKKQSVSKAEKNSKMTPNKVKAISKSEKEKAKAKARLERAKLLDEKRQQKKKALDDRKKAMAHKKEEYRLEKLRKKEERIARRDMIKSESREDKIERINREKKLKAEQRQARRETILAQREENARLRREKLQAQKELKKQKRELRLANKKDKRNRGYAGWLAAVISLGCTTLVLATLFTLSLAMRSPGGTLYESAVERTFYDFVSYVDNMDVNMSKLMVSSEKSAQQRLLSELSIQANLAASDITELPLQDDSKYYTTKYINQVGDYAKYLNNKLIDGGTLSESDWQNISSLYQINTSLKGELTELTASLGENYEFVSLLDSNQDNIVLDKFIELESNAVEYPKMIYDGPFSDSLNASSAKGIKGKEITSAEAETIFMEIFNSYGIQSAELVGETNGTIQTYNIEGELSDDEMIYAQISKIGGKLVMFDAYKTCEAKNYSQEECIAVADKFLKDIGLKNMSAVWTTTSGNLVYLNYAYEQDGVIIYPDMCKVTVCMERGEVSAFEGSEYYLNHTARKIEKAKISQETAMKNLSTNLIVDTVRLAYIPKGNQELLAYEIAGTFNGATYYVYVDALTGKESQIFRVVETTEGMLIM